MKIALIIVPARSVLSVAEECGKKDIMGLFVESAGFGETGNNELATRLTLMMWNS